MTADRDDRNQSQEQLLAELTQLRAELDSCKRRNAEREAEHEHVEAALRRSQTLIKQMISRLPQILYIANPKTYRLLYVNEQFTKILGYSREDLQLVSQEIFSAVLHPDDQTILQHNADRWASASDDDVIEFEYRARHANGTWRWLQSREVVFARDAAGQPMQIFGTAFDITDRKEMELALQQSETRLQDILHHISDWFWEVDANAVYTYVSGRVKELLGYEPEAVLGKTPFDLMLPAEAKRIAEVFGLISQERRAFRDLENINLTQAGHEIILETSGVPIFDTEGNFQGYRGVDRDVTARKQAEAELRQSKQFIEKLTDSLPHLLFIYDFASRRILYMNRQSSEMLGYQPEDMLQAESQAFSETFHPEDLPLIRAQLDRIAAASDGEVIEFEYRRQHADGSWRWRRSRQVVFSRDAEGRPAQILGTSIDITDTKRLEERNQQAQVAIRQSAARYALATRAARVGVWEWNLQTRDYYLDANIKALLGYSDAEIPNDIHTWSTYCHPDDKPLIAAAIREHLQQRTPEFTVEHRALHKDGSIRWLMVRGATVWDQQGKPVRGVGTATDITDRKQAEAARRQSEEKLTKFLGATPDPVSITTLETGVLLEGNESFYQISGYRPEDVVGRSLLSDIDVWLRPEDRVSLVKTLRERGSIRNAEFSFRTKSGEIVTVLTSAELIELEGQRCILATHKDISDRKRAEEELRQSEQKFRQLVENIRDVFFVVAPDNSQFFYISPAYEAIWGRSCESLYQQPHSWLESIHPDDYDRVRSYCQQMLNPVNHSIEYRIIRPDGLLRWVLYRTFPIVDQPGQVSRIAGIVKDITDRKQIEAELKHYRDQLETLVIERTAELNQANQQLQQELQQRKQTEATLREAESRWRTLLENVPLLVMGLDTEGRINYVNPFMLQVTGYTRDEVLNKNYVELFHPTAQLQTQLHQKRSAQPLDAACGAPLDIATKTGEVRKIACNSTVLHNSQGETVGMLAIGKDITEQYLLDRMKKEFISIVSHELRTPLTSIHGALDLLADGLVDLHSDRAGRIIAIAAEGAEYLVRLVDDILTLERLESGEVELVKQPCLIAELMLKATDLMQLVANRAGITLSVTPLDIQLQGDSDRILQLLTNLLSNAIKFSDRGDTVWLSAEQVSESADDPAAPRHYARFVVRDQGRGIPPDKLETIFERFQQVDASDARQKGGTGLGLAICRSIVQQHGGKIWAESTLGEGSCFYFTLPVGADALI